MKLCIIDIQTCFNIVEAIFPVLYICWYNTYGITVYVIYDKGQLGMYRAKILMLRLYFVVCLLLELWWGSIL